MALAFGAALAGGAIAAAIPAVERQIIDQVITTHRQPLWPWLTLMTVLAVATFAFAYIRRYVGGRVSLDVQFDLRNAIFDQLQRLDSARHDEMQTGQLVSRANSDVGLLQGLLAFLPMMSGNVLLLVASLVIMFIYSPLLALVSLAMVPALLVTAYRMRRQTFPANWDAQQKEGEVAVIVEEAVTGVRVVKGFGQEAREHQRLVDRATTLFGARMRAVRLQARYQPVLSGLPALGEVAVLALGGWMALNHHITLGTFLAFATYLMQMASPARMLAGVLIVGQQARAGAQRVLDLLAANPVVTEKPDAHDLHDEPAPIRFESVTFGYSRADPVLEGFDLDIAPGETVALVGASGSGKSTVALLLPRFYDVHDGAVKIGGVDVRDVTLSSLRSRIGVVFEESFLFSDTVRSNIAYARPDASDLDVEAAAKAAEAHRFISELPDGYDTVVGERGLTLSGGQRQRIALARALLSDPRILILDDATSAVDAKVEADIQATLRRVMQGRTTLLVAHRRSTLRLADRIAVVDSGKVLDQGTHAELMERCRVYRLLLGGPGEDIESLEHPEGGLVADLDADLEADLDAGWDGVTPELWPYDRLEEDDDDVDGTSVPAAGGRPALGAGLRGMGGGGGGGGWMSAMGPTPELLEQVAALPPATDDPQVDVAAEAADDPGFSLRRFVRPYRAALAAGLGLVIIDALAGIAGPLLIRNGLDRGVAQGSATALWITSTVFLGVVLADWVDSIFQVLVTGRTAERMLFALRVKIWAHLQRLSLDFYEREMAGRIMTRMTTDVDALSNLLNSGLINAIVSLFTIVGVGVAMLVWNVELGLVALSVAVPLAVATVVYRRLSGRAYARARDRIAVVNANMQESLSGVRESQAFRREDGHSTEFRRLAGGYLDARLRAQRLVATYFPFVEFLADMAAVLVLGVASVLVADGSLTTGELIGFLLYLDLFFSPIQQLSQTFDAYQQAGASMAQINSLMTVRPLVTDPPEPVAIGAAAPGQAEGRIALSDVSFAYPSGRSSRLALRHVDLEIPAGQTVALVGETGAGKSTVIKLLTRFYDPVEGTVSVDGQDLRLLDLAAYRHRVGYVPQEAHLFSGTIRDNIAYGRPDATDSEVEAAARAVGAHDVIARLSNGYLHQVTERGRSLSVGQRQLIALARAQLVDPSILLLDEATSNLDLATEAKVSQAMGVLAAGRTTVLIAHRLQTARSAERIVVLDDGRVVEDGSHEQLVALGGRYAEMWQAFSDSGVQPPDDAWVAGVPIQTTS